VLLCAVQYRLALADELDRLFDFGGPERRDEVLPGLAAFYRTVTRQTLLSVGEASKLGRQRLSEALGDGSIDLNLFAPGARSDRMKLAIVLHDLGRYQESLAALGAAEWPMEEQFDAHYWRARNLIQFGDRDGAIDALLAALQVNPQSADVLLRLAQLQFLAGRNAQAETALKRLLELEPGNPAAKVQLAYVYGERKRYDEAARLAREVLGVDPENEDARVQFMLYRQHNLEDREEQTEGR